MKQLILLILISAFGVGCATFKKPVEHTFDKTITVSKDFETVWGKVIKYFATKSIPIKTIEKNSGIIVSEPLPIQVLADADKFDCGSYSNKEVLGNFQTGTASFNVFVEKIDSAKSKITVNTLAGISHAMPGLYGTTVKNEYKCYSTGNFEKLLFEEFTK